MNSRSDKDLMLLVRDGQVDQLRHLFERHNAKLYNYFVMLTGDRSVSEDLTQDVFLRMLRFRHTFKGKGSFISWMFQIARNIGIDHYRKNRNCDPLEVHLDIKDAEPSPLDASVKQQQVEILHRALLQLSPKHREVILLARFDNLPLKEIAKILRCPVNSVKVKIHRAVNALGAIYSELAEVQQDVV